MTLSDDETRKFKIILKKLLDQLLLVYQKQNAQIDAIVTEVKKSLLILQLPIDTNIQEDFLQSNVIDGVKRKSLSKKNNNNNNTLGERKKLRSIKKKRTRSLQKRFRKMNKYYIM